MYILYIYVSCLEFNYTFKWVDDGAYGYKNKETGEWNGLMGELLSQVSLLLFLKLKDEKHISKDI